MFRWVVIIAALVLYGVVLSCVMLPTRNGAGQNSQAAAAPIITSRDGLPMVAVGMQIQRTDWIDKYMASIDEIAALGADAVKFVVDTRQETVKSTHIFLDMRKTPTPDQLGQLIKHAKSKKLRVILMPIVLLDNPRGLDWRGVIEPEKDYGGWNEWFDSYRDMMGHFSWIAEANGVDIFVVGSEFVSAQKQVDQWNRTIQFVRERYHGRLTYSSNWDAYKSVHFWDKLDLIGLNSYWKFGEEESNENPSIDHIKKRWTEIQADLLPFVREQGKPLLFLEIGWFSQTNVAYEPWDYTKDKPVDLELQRKLYQAFFESWWGKPELGGFSVWEWPPIEGGPKDNGYTPKNKPAEKVLREWFAKPRWEVK